MKIRDAVRDDLAEIVAMLADDRLGRTRESSASGDLAPYHTAFDAITADPKSRLIVGEDDGVIVATLQVTFIPNISLTATTRALVEGVRVAADRRGAGLGERLFAFVEEAARAQGCGLVQLTMNKSRTDAARFYKRLGFEATHEGFKKAL